MASQNFVDYVKICCRSGKGGQGSTHMHRDKTTSKGGPDGGDGGRRGLGGDGYNTTGAPGGATGGAGGNGGGDGGGGRGGGEGGGGEG